MCNRCSDHTLQRPDADLKRVSREADFFPLGKNSGPAILRVIEQLLDVGLQLRSRILVAETEVKVASPVAGKFVVELGEDELEDLFENIDAGIGEHFILHVFDEIAQGAGEQTLLIPFLFLFDEGIDRPRLPSDVLDGLRGRRQVGDFDDVIGIFAVPDDGRRAIAPKRERRAGSVSIAFELVLAGLGVRRLHFDHAIGDRRSVGVPNDDVGAFRRVAPEGDRNFDGEARNRIFVVAMEMLQPQLADDFFMLGSEPFVADEAADLNLAISFLQALFDLRNRAGGKDVECVVLCVLEQFQKGGRIHGGGR